MTEKDKILMPTTIYILIEVTHGFSMGERSTEAIKGYTFNKEVAEKFASQGDGYCSYKYQEVSELHP